MSLSEVFVIREVLDPNLQRLVDQTVAQLLNVKVKSASRGEVDKAFVEIITNLVTQIQGVK